MTERIPQSTSKLVVFKAYLANDHVTEATGKTIAITISQNGGAFGNPNVGALNATEISSGWYKVTLDTTDTGTLGPLAVRGAVALVDDIGILHEVVSATTGGATNLDTTVSSRLASGSYTAPSNLTAAQIATGVWTDTTAGDFTVSASVGKSVMNGVALGTGLTVNDLTTKTGFSLSQSFPTNFSSLGITAGGHITTVDTVTTVTNQLTAAAIATGVWTDTTGSDFTTALSVGKSIMNGVTLGTGLTVAAVSGAVGSVTGLTASDIGTIKTKTDFLPSATAGAAGGVFIAGTNAATTITTALTTTFTGNLTGSVASVSGAVGSVTGLTASDVGAIKLKTDLIPAAPAAVGDIPTANQNADALLDRTSGIETGVTPRGLLRLLGAVMAGKVSGAGTGTETFRNTVADSKDRIVATVDSSGNRTAITTDQT